MSCLFADAFYSLLKHRRPSVLHKSFSLRPYGPSRRTARKRLLSELLPEPPARRALSVVFR